MAHFVFYDTPQEVAAKAAVARYVRAGDRVMLGFARMSRLLAKYSPEHA
jgi:hypothetical protein